LISFVRGCNSDIESGLQLVLFDIGGVLINWHDSWLYLLKILVQIDQYLYNLVKIFRSIAKSS